MSFSHSLGNALSGLTAASRAAEVVSSNLANALTDGYGRRELDLSAQSVGGRGAGVGIDGVSRHVNPGILADRRLADAESRNVGVTNDSLQRLERMLGQPGQAGSLTDRLNALESALIEGSSQPESSLRLNTIAARFGDVAATLNRQTKDVQAVRLAADTAIGSAVDRLNTALKDVEKLNAEITKARQRGLDGSALFDQRQVVVDRISELVPVRVVSRANDQIALLTPGGGTLLDGPAGSFGFTRQNVMTADLSIDDGTLGALSFNGTEIDISRQNGPFAGGEIAAQFAIRDEVTVSAQADLDRVAVDLARRFQGADATAGDPTGTHDVFTLAGRGRVDPADTTGLAGRLVLNDRIRDGDPAILRDGLDATTPADVGDGRRLQSLLDRLTDPDAGLGAGSALTVATEAASRLSTARLEQEDRASFAESRAFTLKQAELAEGVNSDAELQRLLLIEQAYAANAKVVQTIDAMIRQLMEI